MNDLVEALTADYVVNALAWIAIWAAAGLVARPLINRIGKGRDR